MLKIRANRLETIQVGIWQRGETLEVVWFDEKNQACFLLTDIQHPLSMPKKSARQQKIELSGVLKFKFITAILPQHIWMKTLILPHILNEQECEQQCRFTLQNELPIPLEELWFDYVTEPLKQGFRLDIFSIMQKVAKAHLEPLSPLRIDVLDNVNHCILRAFGYLFPNIKRSSTLFLYQDEQSCFALQDRQHELRVIYKTPQKLTALYAEFCERYKEIPEQVIFYHSLTSTESFPADWLKADIDLPFIALGAALWQKDLQQDEMSH